MNHLVRSICLVALLLLPALLRADDWPQWMGSKRDAVWRETGILEKFPRGGPKGLWRVKIQGGYSGPAVADGLVYVMDYATSANTKQLSDPGKRPAIKGKERVLCLDAKTGKEVWKHEYDCPYEISYPAGPRCTPTVSGGKVYTVGAEGNLYCLDAKNGKVLWSKDFKKDYGAKTATWGFASHPLVDGQRLICVVGGKGSVAVAFDKDTGKEVWKAISASEQGYSPPTLITAAGKKQLLIWDAEKINSLDPEKGTVYWTFDLKPNYGMSIMAPRLSGDSLFAGGIGFVSAAVKLGKDSDKPTATELWRGNNRGRGMSPINMTPFVEGETIYGFDKMGQLCALDLKTGKRLWETMKPLSEKKKQENSGTGFVVKNGERFFIFNEQGELIICKLSREGYTEIDRAKLLEPTSAAFGRDVVWTHPAFANKCIFARNDREIVCYSLAK